MAAASGSSYTVLLTERGGLMCFGGNTFGQLGRGDRENHFLPALLGGVGPVVGDALEELPGSDAMRAARALDIGPWGQRAAGQIAAAPHPFGGEALLAVAAGFQHTVCATDGGAVYAAGYNNDGQLGLGDLEHRSLFARVRLGAAVQMVACGWLHTLALTRTGEVWAWGSGGCGQNGHPPTQDQSVPARVAGLAGIAMVAGGKYHSVAVGADGCVWTWGESDHGALGHGDADGIAFAAPRVLGVPVFGGDAVLFVAAGHAFTAAVTKLGALWTWGINNNGQLGLGDLAERRVPAMIADAGPPPAWGGSSVRMVSCSSSGGDTNTFAVTEDGAVWSWGTSFAGALGHDGTMPNGMNRRLAPARIPRAAFGGARIVLVSAGQGSAKVAVCNHGLVHVWGRGALGGAATEQRSDVPLVLSASVFPGARCGRGGGLSRQHTVAFMQGLQTRLGVQCVYRGVLDDVITGVMAQGRVLNEPYKRMHEGLRRLLAVDVRLT